MGALTGRVALGGAPVHARELSVRHHLQQYLTGGGCRASEADDQRLAHAGASEHALWRGTEPPALAGGTTGGTCACGPGWQDEASAP